MPRPEKVSWTYGQLLDKIWITSMRNGNTLKLTYSSNFKVNIFFILKLPQQHAVINFKDICPRRISVYPIITPTGALRLYYQYKDNRLINITEISDSNMGKSDDKIHPLLLTTYTQRPQHFAYFNMFRPRQSGCYFADDIFKCNF